VPMDRLALFVFGSVATIRRSRTPSQDLISVLHLRFDGCHFMKRIVDSWTGVVDSVHSVVDLFHDIFYRKIIHLILKIIGAWNFANTPTNFSGIIF
jgi:hypothetical protein